MKPGDTVVFVAGGWNNSPVTGKGYEYLGLSPHAPRNEFPYYVSIRDRDSGRVWVTIRRHEVVLVDSYRGWAIENTRLNLKTVAAEAEERYGIKVNLTMDFEEKGDG